MLHESSAVGYIWMSLLTPSSQQEPELFRSIEPWWLLCSPESGEMPCLAVWVRDFNQGEFLINLELLTGSHTTA